AGLTEPSVREAARAVAAECEAAGGPAPTLFQADLAETADRSRLQAGFRLGRSSCGLAARV
ncbi:MAG: hypothetical protein WCP63_11310, partial [Cyanobium sp. ELA712]